MTKVIAFPVMVLAGLGVAACLFASAAVAVSPAIEKSVLVFLFPGVFVVWFPTILLMNRLTRDFKQRDIRKAALRGCPQWMRATLWIIVDHRRCVLYPFSLGRRSG